MIRPWFWAVPESRLENGYSAVKQCFDMAQEALVLAVEITLFFAAYITLYPYLHFISLFKSIAK